MGAREPAKGGAEAGAGLRVVGAADGDARATQRLLPWGDERIGLAEATVPMRAPDSLDLVFPVLALMVRVRIWHLAARPPTCGLCGRLADGSYLAFRIFTERRGGAGRPLPAATLRATPGP